MAEAQSAAEQGQPFAEEFAVMVSSAFGDDRAPLLRATIARRPLKPHEASPVSVVGRTVMAAVDSGDRDAVQEALQVGLSLLAKWPAFLDGFIDGHPDFERRPEGPAQVS